MCSSKAQCVEMYKQRSAVSWSEPKGTWIVTHGPYFLFKLKVKQAGVSIQKIVPGLQTMGICLDQYFRIVHPEVPFTISSIQKFINSQFVFQTRREMMPESWKERPMLELRGTSLFSIAQVLILNQELHWGALLTSLKSYKQPLGEEIRWFRRNRRCLYTNSAITSPDFEVFQSETTTLLLFERLRNTVVFWCCKTHMWIHDLFLIYAFEGSYLLLAGFQMWLKID